VTTRQTNIKRRKLMAEESKPKGWFSRRHSTGEAHQQAQLHHRTKSDRKQIADERRALADTRDPQQRINELDARLGKGRGAHKERERLNKMIAGA
jgi:hypothetical protein